MSNDVLSAIVFCLTFVGILVGIMCVARYVSKKSDFTTVESDGWSVRDLIETIQKEDKPVGFSIPWAEWSVTVQPHEAIQLLNRFAPDARLRVSRTCGTLFIRGKV